MSFSKFFRKKSPDHPSALPATTMKVAQSLDNIKNYNKTAIQTLEQNNDTMTLNGELREEENRLDDISVHLAASKYSNHFSRRSQLFKSLSETLSNKDALSYFIQFLETKGKSNLIKFCLDVQTFKTSFTTQSTQSPEKSPDSPDSDWSLNLGHDSKSISTTISNGDASVQSTQSCHSAGALPHHEQGEAISGDVREDALMMFKKYFTWESRHRLDVPDEVRDEVERRVSCCQDDQLDRVSCFKDCESFVFSILENQHYPAYLQSSHHCKHQLDILTGNNLTIMDIMYHDTSLSYFTEFMEQSRCIDLLQCFLDVDNFHRHYSSHSFLCDSQVVQEDAMIIYDRFFSLQARRPLNLSCGIRLEVEGAICREGGTLPDCFLLPRSLLLFKMDQVHFPKFLKSDLYYKHLVDLINTVHAANDIPGYKIKRTGSDASSEKSFETASNNSFGSRNTLLAVDTLSKTCGKLRRSKVGMQIDGSLFDPDTLWHRPNTSLKFGHVNSLGEFIPEFEPEPDHQKKKFSFSFTKKNTRSDEDHAMQVAQKILQDVNILTNHASNVDEDGCLT